MTPPTNVNQIDVDRLNLERFKRHAVRKGIDPDTITRENVLDNFDPVQTRIEFTNRLASLPLGLATLLLAFFSFGAKKQKAWITGLAWFSLADVVVNAVMGAIVVRSGLQPGIITLHMALAFLLIAVLVTILWLSRPESFVPKISQPLRSKLQIVSLLFFVCLFGEGLLGSQLREQTDELAITAETGQGIQRAEWNEELGATIIFKIHRSFSWSLLLTSGLLLYWTRGKTGWRAAEPKLIFTMVVAMMLMGFVPGHIATVPVIQVLHIGMTSILLAITWHWIMRLWSTRFLASET